MELEFYTRIKINCHLAKMKAYKKWTKASRNWEAILPNTARCTMYTSDGRHTEKRKNTSSEVL